MKLERSFLIHELKCLQGDEFNFEDVASAPKKELVLMLIECAYYHREQLYSIYLNN